MSGAAVLTAANLLLRRSSRRSLFELRVDRLELRSGEALAILGPNGSGKTTLLRALAGLDPPVRGTLARAADGPVTMVFQRPIAFDGSVAHNVRAALRGARLSRAEARNRAEQALARFGIGALAGRRAAQLSAGELRRLALARAFALEPAVLLLDEPFDDLDADAQEALSIDLRGVIDETGVAVAVVTHDLRRAVLLSDRIAVLLAGALQQVDLRERVLARPKTPAVARLVGMTNLIPGVVRANRTVEVDPEHAIQTRPELAPGTRVWVGLRGEHVKLDVGRGQRPLIGKGVVRQLVSDGLLMAVKLEWAGLELRTHLVSGRGLARTLAPGDAVSIAVRAEDAHVMPRGDDGLSDADRV
jgi:ABC-type sulfate/molybdate transport systems ATPase subunit